MNRALIGLISLWPLTALPVDGPMVDRSIPIMKIESKDLSIEYLAYSFFHHYSGATETLKSIISAGGVERILPEIAAQSLTINDHRQNVLRARQLCADLKNAEDSLQFATVLASGEERELKSQQEAAGLILSKLDAYDRKALEEYLDAEFRTGIAVSRVDFVAMIASEPFPSSRTTKIVRRVCDAGGGGAAMRE